ncbi:MAG: thymidine kinase, partial [Pseudomonadota bacterium]
MAKLYFHFSTMNAGKSTLLLQAAHNYREGGMATYLVTAQFDNRAGEGRIASRIGIGEAADTFAPGEDMFAKLKARLSQGPVACVFIDEAQFLSKEQVWQLARAVDDLKVPVMCYGLRVDFQGNLF